MVFEYKHNGVEAVHLSLSEFDKYACDPVWHQSPKNEGTWSYRKEASKTAHPGFYDENLAEVRTAVATGWRDGMNQLKSEREKLKLPDLEIKDLRRKRRRNNHRGNVDTDRLTQGNAHGLFIRRQREASNHTPIISLVVTIGGLANVSQQQLFWCGATACFLAEKLEAAGYRTEIIATSMARQSEGLVNVSVSVKAPDEQFRLSTLAAVTALPSTFRTMFWLARCKSGKKIHVNSGMGRTCPATASDFHVDNPAWRKGAVIVPHIYNEKDARFFIEDTIKGIELGIVS